MSKPETPFCGVDALEDVLCWSPCDHVLAEAARRQDELANERVTELSAHRGPRRAELAGLIAHLTETDHPALRRTLSAPQTMVRVVQYSTESSDALASHVETALLAELHHAGGGAATPTVNWTAYGEPSSATATSVRFGVWVKPCLRIADGPVLDFGSQYWHERQQASTNMYDDADVEAVAEGFVAAQSALMQISPDAARFVSRSIKSVLCYRLQADGFLSGSMRFRFGQIECSNPHLMMLDDTTEALVHESVHVFIESLELFEPLYVPVRDRVSRMVRSPWSGREIPATALVHACFVWYALYWFWRRAMDVPSPISRDRARMRRDRAARGFYGSSLCDTVAGIVEPSVVRLVERCRRRVMMDAAALPSA